MRQRSDLSKSPLPRSEIYQVTGPVERFAGQIASNGYVVGAYFRSKWLYLYYSEHTYLLQFALPFTTSSKAPRRSLTTSKVSVLTERTPSAER